MTTRLIAKRVLSRSALTSSRIFTSARNHPSFQLLNNTKADNTRFFSTAPKANPKPSILEEFLRWVRRKQSSNKRETTKNLSSRGLEISVDVSGFGKDDIKVEMKNGKLMINGVKEDMEIKQKINILDFPFKFDPENVWAEICNDVLKIRFPFSENKQDKYKKGRYSVKWI
ncbi:hypothetical protein Tco_0040652 [Tanacetum coccineum]